MANRQRTSRQSGSAWGVVKRRLVGLGQLLFVSLGVLLLVFGLVLRLPASLLAASVESYSRGNVRLIVPAGQIRSGRAELWLRDVARREWIPWMPVEWTLTPVWQVVGPALVLSSNVGNVRVDRSGLSISDFKTSLPPSLLLAGLNHPLAKAPWRGDIELASDRIACDWAGLKRKIPSCDGQATLRWQGMGSSILPLQEIGSYATLISAQSKNNGIWRADISTESGLVLVDGVLEVKSGEMSFRVGIEGEKELIDGLDSVAGPAFKRHGNTGQFLFEGKL